jgi:3-oxoacyl-[acyl-carrier-protein] synthase II
MTTKEERRTDKRDGAPAVVGLGAVTGYGWGRDHLLDGMLSGEPSVRLVTGLAPYFEHDSGFASRIPDGGDPADGPSRFTRSMRFAAREALADATERGWKPEGTVGVISASVLGDVDAWRAFHHRQGRGTGRRGFVELMPSTVVTEIMREFEFHGPAMAVHSMCASGGAGLLTARLWIAGGLADHVLLLAADLSAWPENMRPVVDLGALVVDEPALDACRPFQEGSRGFTVGEATVAMVVSRSPEGAYGRVLGGSMTHDAYHAMSIDPSHEQVRRVFAQALDDAAVAPEEVAYLNAHGPGTRQCDTAEAEVFDELLPDARGLYSLKPLVGHCQGAAGAVELLSAFDSFESDVIPAPPKVATGHPRLLDGPTKREEGLIVKSSLGMGGSNAVVVIEKGKGGI